GFIKKMLQWGRKYIKINVLKRYTERKVCFCRAYYLHKMENLAFLIAPVPRRTGSEIGSE
ncbi:MAG: hypothetical protein LBH86_02385, partial [Oscillospiraceae bacterium]|nr:hypothetical protein [Oscillospiraceae bacterium]